MKKIIGIIHPFDKYQTFYVYEDGNKLNMTQVKMQKVLETIFQLSKKYQAYQIDLTGSRFYSKKLAQQIQEKELVEYDKHKLTITCI